MHSKRCELCGGELELFSVAEYACKECRTRYSMLSLLTRKFNDYNPEISDEMVEYYRGYKTKW